MAAKKATGKKKASARRKAKQEEPVTNTGTNITRCTIVSDKRFSISAEHLQALDSMAKAVQANAEAIKQLSLGMDLERVSITDNSIGMKIEGSK